MFHYLKTINDNCATVELIQREILNDHTIIEHVRNIRSIIVNIIIYSGGGIEVPVFLNFNITIIIIFVNLPSTKIICKHIVHSYFVQ